MTPTPRLTPPGQCAFCGAPATLFCDFVLGFEITGWTMCNGNAAYNADRLEEYVPGKGLPYTGEGGECFTCDAPMCDACARHDGHIFFDGDKQHTRIESIDTCPFHARLRYWKRFVISAETAETIRRQAWKMHVARPMEPTP